ncbi:Cof-type HAD-IIB family hydrolase [Hutsoniella sourekii]
MIKLIAIDLDGTLLDSNHNLSEENIKALHFAKNKGVKIVICTGRPYPAMKDFVDQINLNAEDDYFITYNGGIIFNARDRNKITENYFTVIDLKVWSDEMKRIDLPISAIDIEKVYEPLDQGELSQYSKVTPLQINKINFSEIPDDQRFYKFVCCAEKEVFVERIKNISPELLGKYSVKQALENSIDITPRNASKGNALAQLSNLLKIEPSNIMAIGDQDNDYSMIAMAGTSVAMGNAIEKIKEAADYITGDNNQSGVAQAIYHYLKES